MTEPQWTLPIQAPDRFLSLNDRAHWRQQAQCVQQWRNAAYHAAVSAKLPKGLQRVRITAGLRFPDRRRRDASNYHATLKPIIDGLAAARAGLAGYGLIPDDDPAHLDGPHIRIDSPMQWNRPRPYGLVILHITDLSGCHIPDVDPELTWHPGGCDDR